MSNLAFYRVYEASTGETVATGLIQSGAGGAVFEFDTDAFEAEGSYLLDIEPIEAQGKTIVELAP